jgi:hypothetical protein
MNTWDHSLLSQRKFGGIPEDYEKIHRFIDSSKLFYYHLKHRLLLHNLYGVELCMELFGDTLVNSDGNHIIVRDIAVEHCKEDLDGKIPTLADWLKDQKKLTELEFELPDFQHEGLQKFMSRPLLRSGLSSSLFITHSDFGLYLVETFFSVELAVEVSKKIQVRPVQEYLENFAFTAPWQYNPQRKELEWLSTLKKR